jgi:hypothetical protein
MRLAIIRQRYTPHGGAERFLEGALEALLERNVAITLYTREWPQIKLQLIEPHVVNPPYFGALWRDWGFARAVTGKSSRRRRTSCNPTSASWPATSTAPATASTPRGWRSGCATRHPSCACAWR